VANMGKSFFHWGDNGYNKSFIVASENSKDAVVFFTNSANGLSFMKEIVGQAVGGDHPSVEWLDYERYDSPGRQFLKSVVEDGPESALTKYRAERKKDSAKTISERQMNRLGYTLLRAEKFDEAIAVFKQNTEDFPESANVWDSLAEACMKNGDKKSAIKFYKKSFELDQTNKNAEENIKKLSNN